jgi:hypothetical protein
MRLPVDVHLRFHPETENVSERQPAAVATAYVG